MLPPYMLIEYKFTVVTHRLVIFKSMHLNLYSTVGAISEA